jgi:hypothetical protein
LRNSDLGTAKRKRKCPTKKKKNRCGEENPKRERE